MGGRQTRVQAKSGNDELAVSTTTTDSQLLPIEHLERLQQVAPHRVDWVFDQTALESEHRRAEQKRVNTLIFVERIAGLVFALLVAVVGLGLASYLAINGKEVTASIIGGTTLVGLVATFIVGKRSGK